MRKAAAPAAAVVSAGLSRGSRVLGRGSADTVDASGVEVEVAGIEGFVGVALLPERVVPDARDDGLVVVEQGVEPVGDLAGDRPVREAVAAPVVDAPDQ